MKTNIVINISNPISGKTVGLQLWAQYHCEPIKLQGSLKCNISNNMWIINFIFCMQINIKAL